MKRYLVLLRGVNVGGKNKISMASLAKYLEDLGFSNVSTFIASGNVILDSSKKAHEVKTIVEKALTDNFELDDELIRVLVLSRDQLQAVIDNKPAGFGEEPEKYHSDAIFLIDISPAEAMSVFKPREGVDTVWPGNGVIYSQRLSSRRTQSRLSRIMTSPLYKLMTIRNWNTVTKLSKLL